MASGEAVRTLRVSVDDVQAGGLGGALGRHAGRRYPFLVTVADPRAGGLGTRAVHRAQRDFAALRKLLAARHPARAVPYVATGPLLDAGGDERRRERLEACAAFLSAVLRHPALAADDWVRYFLFDKDELWQVRLSEDAPLILAPAGSASRGAGILAWLPPSPRAKAALHLAKGTAQYEPFRSFVALCNAAAGYRSRSSTEDDLDVETKADRPASRGRASNSGIRGLVRSQADAGPADHHHHHHHHHQQQQQYEGDDDDDDDDFDFGGHGEPSSEWSSPEGGPCDADWDCGSPLGARFGQPVVQPPGTPSSMATSDSEEGWEKIDSTQSPAELSAAELARNESDWLNASRARANLRDAPNGFDRAALKGWAAQLANKREGGRAVAGQATAAKLLSLVHAIRHHAAEQGKLGGAFSALADSSEHALSTLLFEQQQHGVDLANELSDEPKDPSAEGEDPCVRRVLRAAQTLEGADRAWDRCTGLHRQRLAGYQHGLSKDDLPPFVDPCLLGAEFDAARKTIEEDFARAAVQFAQANIAHAQNNLRDLYQLRARLQQASDEPSSQARRRSGRWGGGVSGSRVAAEDALWHQGKGDSHGGLALPEAQDVHAWVSHSWGSEDI